MNPNLDRLSRDIMMEMDEEFQRSGILYRIFVRPKSEESIKNKLLFKQYEKESKLMQDIIGVRMTMYFVDDLPIIYNVLKSKSNFVDETIDETEETVFKPTRVNLIFRLDELKSQEIKDTVVSKFKYIDTTYEVQLRTVLSEGWHEVDHDLRYKCQQDWQSNSDLARTFNGVYASLVTNDWSILTIFEQLAYRQYKNKNWPAMIRNRFRLRLRAEPLNEKIIKVLNNDPDLAKSLYRIERNEFLKRIVLDKVRIPLTMSNLIFILNAYFLKDTKLKQITPDFILNNKQFYK